MDLQLNGKVALVTAASRGLGRAVAMRLAQEGADTVICARSYDDLSRTAAEIRSAARRECLAIQTDLTQDSDIRSLVTQTLDHMGRIDILVTNAGGPPPGGFLDVPLRAWGSASELTLMSAVRLCKAVVPAMIDRRTGSILAVTSISVKQPVQGLVLSTSMRLGVVGLIKTLAVPEPTRTGHRLIRNRDGSSARFHWGAWLQRPNSLQRLLISYRQLLLTSRALCCLLTAGHTEELCEIQGFATKCSLDDWASCCRLSVTWRPLALGISCYTRSEWSAT